MYTIYNSIQELCDTSGIKPGKMCNDIGLSRSILTDLKTGRKKSINTVTAQKIADYFGVSVDRVLGAEQKEKSLTGDADEDEATKELRDIWASADPDERETLLEMARLIKKRRNK